MAQAFRWSGSAMEPMRPKLADETYVIGQVYWLEIEQQRSVSSHNHEFAWLSEAWSQLPESLQDQYPTPESLRKRALIQSGYFDERIIDAGSHASALRVASYVRSVQEFALVIVRDGFVIVREAKSQSRRAMKGKEFQQSKTAIMQVIADLIGVSPETIANNVGRAA